MIDHSAPAGGEPLGVSRGSGPWPVVREAALRHGYAVCHGRLDDWGNVPSPCPRELLGADWPRYRTAREPAVRARLVGSRLMLRHAVAAVSGTEPGGVVVGRDSRGRPVLHEPAGFDVGITHTAEVLVVGVARGRRIGVDVEARDRSLLTAGLAEKFCHPWELAELDALPPAERNRALVRRWTLKEAYVKALGVGLAQDLSRLLVRPAPDGAGWWLGPAAPGWRLRCDLVTGEYVVACALGPDNRESRGRTAVPAAR